MSTVVKNRVPIKTIVQTLQRYIVRTVIGLILIWWALPLFVIDLLVRNAASITCTREMRFARSSGGYSVTYADGLNGCIEHTTSYNVSNIIVLLCSIFLTIMAIGHEATELSNSSDALVIGHRFNRTVDTIDRTFGDYVPYIVVTAVILGMSLLIMLLCSIATMSYGS